MRRPPYDALSFLDRSQYRMYHCSLAYVLGVEAAVLLHFIIERFVSHPHTHVVRDGVTWVLITADEIEYECGMRRKAQECALKTLRDQDLVEQKVFGMPARRYFSINTDNISSLVGI